MNYILRTINLSKKYKDKDVITDVNMNIKKGEIYGFLGPNGAGKTTIMKMILNLIKPSVGEVEIETISRKNNTLEDYFLNLLNGGK